MPSGPSTTPWRRLESRGYDVRCTSHAKAILLGDFSEAVAEIEQVLSGFVIQIEELVRGGGGEAPFTQRLRRALSDRGWVRREFVIRKLIDDVETQATSHEVDHVKVFPAGTLALEIEWNNKDPFFDRDLDNFKRLHADGAISAGVILTRGSALQEGLADLLHGFAASRRLARIEDLDRFGYAPTERQKNLIRTRCESGTSFADAWVGVFKADKFGEATTHWRKLTDRIDRGTGNPCPLLLLGLPLAVVQA